MKERPILFSAPMVRAILEGRKTQTRRVVKARKCPDFGCQMAPGEIAGDGHPDRLCPYGEPGDRLWVREAWRIGAWDCDTAGLAIDYRADGAAERNWINPFADDNGLFEKYWMQCIEDCEAAGLELTVDGGYSWEPGASPCRWRPSIHMPRWASRILLEITGVRVERLQDISEADAEAEGPPTHFKSSRDNFCALWQQINGHGSWDANPWVWVILFKRTQQGRTP